MTDETSLIDTGDVEGATTVEDLLAMAEIDAEEIKAAADTDGLCEMGKTLALMDDQIDAVEDKLKQLKATRERYQRRDMPDAMTKVGVTEFGWALEDGSRQRIRLDTAIFGSLNKAPDEQKAVDFLEANGFDGGVLSKVVKDFTEEERENAIAFSEEHGGKLDRSVNASTLKAFCKERLAEGKPVPFKDLGLTTVPQAVWSKK